MGKFITDYILNEEQSIYIQNEELLEYFVQQIEFVLGNYAGGNDFTRDTSSLTAMFKFCEMFDIEYNDIYEEALYVCAVDKKHSQDMGNHGFFSNFIWRLENNRLLID